MVLKQLKSQDFSLVFWNFLTSIQNSLCYVPAAQGASKSLIHGRVPKSPLRTKICLYPSLNLSRELWKTNKQTDRQIPRDFYGSIYAIFSTMSNSVQGTDCTIILKPHNCIIWILSLKGVSNYVRAHIKYRNYMRRIYIESVVALSYHLTVPYRITVTKRSTLLRELQVIWGVYVMYLPFCVS